MLDIANDHLIFDGNEPLTIVQAGSGRKQVITNGHQFPITAKDAAATDGTYVQWDARFNIPAVEAVVFKPRAGDFIQVGSRSTLETWAIGAVEVLTLKTRLQAWGKRVDLNPATAVELKVYRPVQKRDGSGAAYVEWKLVKVAAGHVKETASELAVNDGRKRLRITHQIFFPETFPAEAGFRVVDPTGKTFNVNRITGKDSIGMAMVLDAEAARTPMKD